MKKMTLEQIIEREREKRHESGSFGIKACKDSIKFEIEHFGENLYKLLEEYVTRANEDIFFNRAMGLLVGNSLTNNKTKAEGGGKTAHRKEERKMFEIGKTYTARCFGDHNLTENWTVISRTAKTMIIEEPYEGTKNGEYAKVATGFSFLRA